MNMMIRTCRIHRSIVESKVGEMGMTRTEHRALMYISKNEHLTSQRELAEHLEITPAAVTGVLQRLEADGFIKRSLGADNRYNEISITQKGSETVKLSRGTFRAVDRAMFKNLTDTELDTFIDLVGKIKENAEKCKAELKGE